MSLRFDEETITVIAGIPPGDSGTGRMMRQLVSKSKAGKLPMRFVYKARPARPVRAMVKARDLRGLWQTVPSYLLGQFVFYLQVLGLMINGSGKLLIMHPQTLGFKLTVYFLEHWSPGKLYMYVLDNSYFCVRSYNHIAGENKACRRCLGGDFSPREELGCEPFPIKDAAASLYTKALLQAGRDGNIKFLSQNKLQYEALKSHFGADSRVKVVGLWGEEWGEPFDDFADRGPADICVDTELDNQDKKQIILHSFFVPAKGADWFLELASRCPDIEFLCPFPKPVLLKPLPENVKFELMTWETGLRDAMERAYMVMVPSLWSAPIEGAFVKSLVNSRRVGIVENDGAFQSEVPDCIVLRLSQDVDKAEQELRQAVLDGWHADPDRLKNWVHEFRKDNECFFENLVEAIKNN